MNKLLFDIKEATDSIFQYLGEKRDFFAYSENKMLQRAVEREFEIIGEAMNNILKINPDFPIKNARRIVDLRNNDITFKIFKGTRIAVWHLVDYFYKVGMSVDEILADSDYLTPVQVFSASAYYHDNKDEIERARQENSYEYWQEHFAHAPT